MASYLNGGGGRTGVFHQTNYKRESIYQWENFMLRPSNQDDEFVPLFDNQDETIKTSISEKKDNNKMNYLQHKDADEEEEYIQLSKETKKYIAEAKTIEKEKEELQVRTNGDIKKTYIAEPHFNQIIENNNKKENPASVDGITNEITKLKLPENEENQSEASDNTNASTNTVRHIDMKKEATPVSASGILLADKPYLPKPAPTSNDSSVGRLSENLMGAMAANNVGSNGKAGMRESLWNYRPSDMQDFNGCQPFGMQRDSLMPRPTMAGRASEMTNILADLDSNYRVSLNTMQSNEYDTPRLLMAAKKGKLIELQTYMGTQSGIPSNQKQQEIINLRDPMHGQNILHFCIRGGQLSTLRYLLSFSFIKENLLNEGDDRLNTPLHLAAVKSRRLTKLLLENSALVDALNKRQQTPLSVHLLTMKRDDPLMAEILLKHGANANSYIEENSSLTLLHNAVDRGLYQIAYRLVRHGGRLDVCDQNGKTIFDKVNRKELRNLIGKITYPPVWIANNERLNCMLCHKKFHTMQLPRLLKRQRDIYFGLGTRRHHCRHCGRLCCHDCSKHCLPNHKFPIAFQNRRKLGQDYKENKRVCKTCYAVFRDRELQQEQTENTRNSLLQAKKKFFNRVLNIEWDELQQNNKM